MNMVKRSLGVISVLATVFAPAGPALAQHGTHSIAQTSAPAKVNETGAALRDLWVGHVFWVRNVVVATLAGNPARRRGGGAGSRRQRQADRRRDRAVLRQGRFREAVRSPRRALRRGQAVPRSDRRGQQGQAGCGVQEPERQRHRDRQISERGQSEPAVRHAERACCSRTAAITSSRSSRCRASSTRTKRRPGKR